MTDFSHTTVLKEEAANLLAPTPGRRVLDGTLGGGGHSEALLTREARVIGIDRDPAALRASTARLARFGDRFVGIHGNFSDARSVLDSLNVESVDGALVDLGVSSPQFDDAERGFSFSKSGPLDMRMDTSSGETLRERLAHTNERELADVIRIYGDESFAGRIARAILAAITGPGIADTRALGEIVGGAIPRKLWPRSIHPATKTFQALRSWINGELDALEKWLTALPAIIAVGGRAAVIAFQSGEDRPVKRRFAELCQGCTCPPDMPVCGCGKTAGWRLLTRKAVVAGEAELEANPRARSARLRCIERLAA